MKVTQQDLISIVERASTINDRLSDRFIPDPLQPNDKSIDITLERWCLLCTQGDWDKFAKRLAWDNLDINQVRQVLGDVKLADEKYLPSWAETLREVLQTNVSRENLSIYRYLETENPVPFEEFYLPFVQVGIERLTTRVNDNYKLLSLQAQISLERSLLKELRLLCEPTLEFEFSLFSAIKQSGLIRLFAQAQGSSAKAQYQSFIKTVTDEGLLSCLKKYNVLARLLATKLDFWVEVIEEFIERLASDLPIINSTFAKKFTSVVEIKLGLSDAHNQGRSVIEITFDGGEKLIYKPRSLGLEVTYFDLLAWFNQHNCPLPFKLLKVINCNTYGWVEYVEHLPCESEAAVQRYYQRAGMLICLLYILGETDGHYENLIASGEHPVLIDSETLIHPDACEFVKDGQELAAEFLANQQMWRSVLRSRLLPTWVFKADRNIAYDMSALGGSAQEGNLLKVRKWKDINTDNMTGFYEYVPIVGANTTSLNGVILLANDYINEIVDGCQQMYQFLVQWRESLLGTDSPLAALATQQVRIIFRDTEIYGQLMRKTLQPKFLQNGVDRSIQLDVLSRAFLMVDTKPAAWAIKQIEIQSLEQMDFPYFSTAANSKDFILSSELMIENCFYAPSCEQAISQLQQLSDADLAEQIGLIRAAFYSRVGGKINSNAVTSEIAFSLDGDEFPLLTSAEIVEEAIAIAKEIAQRAIRGANGSATWISLEYIPNAQRLQLQPLEYGLYDGTSGIALFLAALAKVTGEAEYRDLALAALQPLGQILQDEKSQFVSRMVKEIGIGGASGLGSIVYALVRVSQFVDAPELLDLSKVVASLITPEAGGG
ncbi:type 2 lanthipeptide synthetase LanM family protein, partial [Kamptonema animale CS-326]|uniref:type 2 lanthipeptide synthetase LanM family protein n=1 Tax=Kamptonema animale TaxID=92934 RepID=UPI00232EDE9D